MREYDEYAEPTKGELVKLFLGFSVTMLGAVKLTQYVVKRRNRRKEVLGVFNNARDHLNTLLADDDTTMEDFMVALAEEQEFIQIVRDF